MAFGQGRKFLFDSNNFDTPHIEEIEDDLPPPPPTFSLDELGQARDEAFARGHATALEEALISRDQFIAANLEKMAHEIRFLTAAETYRASVYEREVLTLTLKIFEHCFPSLNQAQSLPDIELMIKTVLDQHREQPRIVIEVPSLDAQDLEQKIAKYPLPELQKIELQAAPDLKLGETRMFWKDGGALRSPDKIAQEVYAVLNSYLARSPKKDQTNAEIDSASHSSAHSTKEETLLERNLSDEALNALTEDSHDNENETR
jgi:flagellar assembly protein FliH